MSNAPAAASPRLVPAHRPDLCLEFADTLYWRGSEPPTESLHGIDDVLAWCRSTDTLDEPSESRLRTWWGARPNVAGHAFADVLAMRETIHSVFAAVAVGGPAPADALARLGRALAAAPARVDLAMSGGVYAWRLPDAEPSPASLLTPVLWSAGDLLVGPRLDRVRRCANAKCQWLFLDDSKGGTRRWCAMSSCGNRAKAHRHAARKKAEG